MAGFDGDNMSRTLFRVRFVLCLLIITGLFIASGNVNAQTLPTMDTPANQVIDEDAGEQTVNLTGITDNDGGGQTITITAVSSNEGVIPNSSIIITYTSPNPTGTLKYTPNTDANDDNGFVAITITVMDIDGSNDVIFQVNVTPINDKPTFTGGPDLPESPDIIYEDDGTFTSSGWATDLNKGGTIGNEGFQDITFNLTQLSTTGNIAFDDILITPTGTISFTLTANTNGVAEFRVELEDDGSNVPPNENLSDPEILFITVVSVNDPPQFTPGSNITIDEGDGAQVFSAWATDISPGGGTDESGQILTFDLVEQSKSTFLTFVTPPSIDPVTGNLTFETEPDATGNASYELTLMDDGLSTAPNSNISNTISFTITVNPINDPPTATVPTLYDSFEDAGDVSAPNFVSGISAGGPDEVTSQTVSFDIVVLNTTGTLGFDILPAIDDLGTLTFTTTENTNGTAEVQISVFDDGSSVSPNDNVGPVSNLTINVEAVNDRPTFTKGTDPALLEDNGATIFTSWATNISPGPSDESGQTVSFQLTEVWTEGTIAFASGPDISPTGDLSFETELHTNGRAAYEIVLIDNDSSGGLNLNTSAIQSLVFEIEAVNDPPTYTIGPDQVADENSLLITIPNWATDMSAGGGTDETDQTALFTVDLIEITGSLVFSIGPLVSPEGDLTFQSAPNTFGIATLLLNLVDDGPSVTPNNNTSDNQSFTITINEINDPPTDIILSNNKIQEKLPTETIIGTFTGLDSDNTSHTFAFVSGFGDDDNGSFIINGDQLLSNETFDFVEKNLYTIRVSASDEAGTIEQIFLIDITREPVTSVTYPSAFTPNGDGENDFWEIESIEYFPGAIITIYNRNGQKVFDSIGYLEPWDGTYNGANLPVDTYYAVIKLNNELDTVNATVTILR